MPIWLQWLIGVGAGITALGVIWRRLAPVVNALENVYPITVAIAAQFGTNKGSSLRDCINEINENITALRDLGEEQKAGLAEVRAQTTEAVDMARDAARSAHMALGATDARRDRRASDTTDPVKVEVVNPADTPVPVISTPP